MIMKKRAIKQLKKFEKNYLLLNYSEISKNVYKFEFMVTEKFTDNLINETSKTYKIDYNIHFLDVIKLVLKSEKLQQRDLRGGSHTLIKTKNNLIGIIDNFTGEILEIKDFNLIYKLKNENKSRK